MSFHLTGRGWRRGVLLTLALVLFAIGDRGARVLAQATPAASRIIQSFDPDWRFIRGDFASAATPAFDDGRWTRVDLPQDWSAAGPFSAELGSGNGYAPGGIAWYRKHFTVPAALSNKIGAIEFDGIYDNSEVWINGHFAGGRPYGYSSFECVLTPFLKPGGADNVIAVRVDHSRFADSRWYTGSGIYRHVRLRFTDPLHIAHWGTVVTTPAATAASATVKVETTIDNLSNTPRAFVLESELILRGTVVARATTPGTAAGRGGQTIVQDITVAGPARWSIETPTYHATKQIEFQIVDAAGVRVPNADAEVTFEIDGPARILGIGNGDLNNLESGANAHRTFQGHGLVILRVTDPASTVTLKASSPGLAGATVTVSLR